MTNKEEDHLPCGHTQTSFQRLQETSTEETFTLNFFLPKFTNDGALVLDSVPTKFTHNSGVHEANANEFVLNHGVVIHPFDDMVRCRRCGCTIDMHREEPGMSDAPPAAKKRRLEKEQPKHGASDPLAGRRQGSLKQQRQLLMSAGSYHEPFLPTTAVSEGQVELMNRSMEIERMMEALKEAIAQTGKPLLRYSVIGTVAIPGGGKTELLRQVCESIAHEAFKPHPCRAVYLSYQVYPDCVPTFPLNPEPGGKQQSHSEAAKYFACLILMSCGVAPEHASVTVEVVEPLAYGIQFLRAVLNAETVPLVICVDELVHLDAQCPGNSSWTLHTLMAFQDENNDPTSGSPPVYFVFSALHKSMVEGPETPIGRPVTVIPLRPLTLEQTFACAGRAVRAKSLEEPKVYQLLLSCAGHPRSVIEGLRHVAKTLSRRTVTDYALHQARERIFSVIKLNFISDGPLTLQAVNRWFDFTTPLTATEDKQYHEWGLLHNLGRSKDVVLFSPLLLLHWSSAHQEERTAEDLRLALRADALVQSGHEKAAESVFYHYEAVRRLAASEKPFRLSAYYAAKGAFLGKTFSKTTGGMYVNCKLPTDAECSCVTTVENFSNVSSIIDLLIGGFIVVSENPDQNGIEYLAPFHDAKTSKLVAIAGVSVKYAVKGTSATWESIHDAAVKALLPFALASKKGKPKYHTFPVIFTTTELCGDALTKELMADGVLLLESATFHWTRALGMLRLHVEKLGTVLADELPFLHKPRGDQHHS